MGRFRWARPTAAALLTLMSWAQFWQGSAVKLGTEALLADGTVEQTLGPVSEALLVERGEDNAESILEGDLEQVSLVQGGDVRKVSNTASAHGPHEGPNFTVSEF